MHAYCFEFLNTINRYYYFDVIGDVKAYQKQNPHRLKLADMTEVEKGLLRKEMLEKGLLG